MGRIKVFLRSICSAGGNDQPHDDPTFDGNIDVSHLAEPHITTVPARISDRTSPSIQDRDNDEVASSHISLQRITPNGCAISLSQHPSSQRNSLLNPNHQDDPSYARPESSLQIDNSSSQPSSPSAPSPFNIYESQNDPTSEAIQNPRPPPEQSPPPVIPRYDPLPSTNSTEPATKLSYDIISVREPLAKILAERQQLLQRQQLQRQLLGEHDYIEVYGERGSSCFYEEIAGSVTSSATYDQIGTNSNHNYQVLINAYAVSNRLAVADLDGDDDLQQDVSPNDMDHSDDHGQPPYNITANRFDQVDHPLTRDSLSLATDPTIPSSSHPSNRVELDEDSSHTKTIPVYSVINKASRRIDTINKTSSDDSRPPKPPPKNNLNPHHHTLQIHTKPESANAAKSSDVWGPLHQIPSTSSFPDRGSSGIIPGSGKPFTSTTNSTHRDSRLPQPPPRLSKNSPFNHTSDRPLPSPNTNFEFMDNNNSGKVLDRNNTEEDDIESLDNGYELLKSNIDEDQVDVGYEKIKESSRYSGGSISSQFYQRPLLDNGGYESVQPIYSSPSNALAEPNYEAIAPATASELAAAATAKLNAAASVIEQFLKKDQ